VILNFEVVLSCLPKQMIDSIFLIAKALTRDTIVNVWCPHGNSDKGHHSSFMEGLSDEKWACVYGKQMVDFLKAKGSYEQLEKLFYVGNYRYRHFMKNRAAYQEIIKREIQSKLNPQNRTLLYAPTWNDCENNSSLKEFSAPLLKSLPKNWNLIIKIHPNSRGYWINGAPNVLILEDFPLIYPLLDFADAYLGDMSSIGYDCLSLRKPLFFSRPKAIEGRPLPPLFQCGEVISSKEIRNIFSIIEKSNPALFTPKQQKLYEEVFTPSPNLERILNDWDSSYSF